MKNCIITMVAFTFLLSANDSFAFGRKKMQISELKGVTEAQVAKVDGRVSVMVRGKAAELVYRTLQSEHQENSDSEALKWLGDKTGRTHYTVRGKQVACSKITRIFSSKKFQDDYACAFEVDSMGNVAAGREAFNPETFDLALTATGSKIFKNKKAQNRSIASVAPSPGPSYSKGHAYLVYESQGDRRKSEQTLIVFRGKSAKEILNNLKNGSPGKKASWGDTTGRRGNEIACVEATEKEPERCAVVVSFKDGSITRSGNPLFN